MRNSLGRRKTIVDRLLLPIAAIVVVVVSYRAAAALQESAQPSCRLHRGLNRSACGCGVPRALAPSEAQSSVVGISRRHLCLPGQGRSGRWTGSCGTGHARWRYRTGALGSGGLTSA